MNIQENVFYLQRALRDEYKVPIRSLNLMPEVFTKEQMVNGINYYSRDTGTLTPGMYFYKISALDRFNNVIMSDEIKATLVLSVPTGSLYIRWSEVPGAIKYIIYGRTADYERQWETSDLFLIDDGTDGSSIPTENGIPEVNLYPYVLFPEFEYNGYKFISPFLYKFNDVYNYYEGWIFYVRQ